MRPRWPPLATLAEKLTIEKAGPIVEALLQAMKGVVEDEKSRIISERLTPLVDAFALVEGKAERKQVADVVQIVLRAIRRESLSDHSRSWEGPWPRC